MSSFPKHVDFIIVGTGLTNSILAAACSRIGKSVLHLDENAYYGDYDASFTFQQLVDWIKVKDSENPCLNTIPEEILNKSRMFCIDLSPKFLFSNGNMVDLLVKSNVARYHEFKNNIRILCLVGQNDIHVMPCRRNEVFTSPLLSNLADKRRLMKFIEMCVAYNDSNELQANNGDNVSEISKYCEMPIGKFLEDRGLKPTLRDYIINSIAMIHPTDTTKEACKRIKKFMIATEKYGRSPFLFPLYGCGEFPQSFCRLSAVFGGIYCLNTKINEAKYIHTSTSENVDNKLKAGKFIVKFGEGKHEVTSDMLVVEYKEAIRLDLKSSSEHESELSRAIIITNKSILLGDNREEEGAENSKSSNDLISFLRIPPTSGRPNKNTIYLIELNSSALVCPKGMNILYLWTKSTGESAEADLEAIVEQILSKQASTSSTTEVTDSCILWKYYYRQLVKLSSSERLDMNCEDKAATTTTKNNDDDNDNGLFVSSLPFDNIDYAGIIYEAECIFKRMCPDQEFLPRAPDPDEIIHSA